jgi:DNA adenine methylase
MLLRYPGGKSRGSLSDKIVEIIASSGTIGVFGEPFFGGGGITFRLLKAGLVNAVVINDIDPAISTLWTEVIRNPDRLVRAIKQFVPSVEAFCQAKARVLANTGTPLDTLVVNRLSHGGRGVLAGPQGGVDQSGKYKIGCRWSVPTLLRSVIEASRLLSCAIGRKCFQKDFTEVLSWADFNYIDPPYWDVGEMLYKCPFKEEDHLRLFRVLQARRGWLLSYNNSDKVRELYRGYKIQVYSTSGNGGNKPNSEVLIYG